MAIQGAESNQTNMYRTLLGRLHQAVAAPASAPPAASTLGQDTFVRAGGGTYTVQDGDSLSKIAQKTMGNGNRWPELYAANKSIISDPNLIHPGMVLTIPGQAAAAAPAKAEPSTPAPKAVYGAFTTMLSSMHDMVAWLYGPKPKPEAKPEPKPAAKPAAQPDSKLASVTTDELKQMGANDKKAFFETLRPAAEAAEEKYGVPAAVTLAQAALESGWGKSAIGGYNIFGIKGTGPAGTEVVNTSEFENGRYIRIDDNFAKYHNFEEAIEQHAKVLLKSYYTKAMDQYEKDKDPKAFAHNITGIYATDPNYGTKLNSIMDTYGLA